MRGGGSAPSRRDQGKGQGSALLCRLPDKKPPVFLERGSQAHFMVESVEFSKLIPGTQLGAEEKGDLLAFLRVL